MKSNVCNKRRNIYCQGSLSYDDEMVDEKVYLFVDHNIHSIQDINLAIRNIEQEPQTAYATATKNEIECRIRLPNEVNV